MLRLLNAFPAFLAPSYIVLPLPAGANFFGDLYRSSFLLLRISREGREGKNEKFAECLFCVLGVSLYCFARNLFSGICIVQVLAFKTFTPASRRAVEGCEGNLVIFKKFHF